MESSTTVSFEENLRRKATYWRVPLLAIPFALLAIYVHRTDAFWYGAAVALFGQAIQTWSGAHIRKDQRLTVSGPYCYVRNPMYMGRFLLILGFVLMASNVYVTVAYVVLFAIYAQTRVLREEPRLKELFVADYERYCAEVRRWLPRLKRYSGSEPRKSSWACVRQNHEDIHTLALVVILAALYLKILFLPQAHHIFF